MVTEQIQHWWPEIPLETCEKLVCTAPLIGLSQILCPVCGAHLSITGICLNACHLGPGLKERFSKMMVALSQDAEDIINHG